MNKEQLTAHFESMSPDESQKSRMRDQILARKQPGLASPLRATKRRRIWLAAPAACLILALVFLFAAPLGGKTSAYAISVKIGEDGPLFKLADNKRHYDDYGTSVSNVDSRPGLEFYIEGDNIARIEITAENEYLYAHDWTQTQHEKYWNVEYYQHFDEERQIAVLDPDKRFDKKIAMTFDKDFIAYDQIWYRWTARNMHEWAAEDNFSRFLGAGMKPDSASPEDALKLTAGNDGSGIGHMQLEGYPEHLKEDTITIKITDRQGNLTTKVIHVKVDNNELRQTVVTASLKG